jgi:hypothetical protein
MLERQTNQGADQRKIIANPNVRDILPENAHRGRKLSSGACAAPREGDDDRAAFSLAAGHWPRVFPGL